ncbi:hypothetical protein D3C75_1140160 [compost metagenome]
MSSVIDLATNCVVTPVPLKSMVVFGAVTSRGSSGTHWPEALGAPRVMVTSSPVTGLMIGRPLASTSGT